MSEAVKEEEVVATEEATTDEATKMLSEAMQKAMAAGDEVAVAKLKTVQDAVEDMLDSVAAVAKAKTVVAEVTEEKAPFDVEKTKEQLAGLQRGAGTVSISVEQVKDIDYLAKSTDITNDLTNDVIAPSREAGIEDIPTRTPFMEQISDVVAIDGDTAEWVEVLSKTGAPATTAELAAIPEADWKFIARRQPVEKIAVMNKHSVEILKHGPELVAAIRTMLTRDLNIVVDGQLLSGNGTAPNLQGVLGVATDLDATAIGTQRVANANLFDVVRIAATKIMSAGKGKFTPNYLILNPVDSERFDLTKNADGDYIMPPFYNAEGQRIRGARVIENTGIAAGTFLLGDFNYLHVRPKGGAEIDFSNSDGTDFANDILSIKVRRFLAAYVKTNNNGAFVTGDIDTAIAALVAA
jgi:hypothetical protein